VDTGAWQVDRVEVGLLCRERKKKKGGGEKEGSCTGEEKKKRGGGMVAPYHSYAGERKGERGDHLCLEGKKKGVILHACSPAKVPFILA